jgi:hypothetical protein
VRNFIARGTGDNATTYWNDPCPDCNPLRSGIAGTGRVEDGTLDPLTLAAVADALEEAGCVGERCNACGPSLESAGIIPRYWCGRCDEQTRRLPHPLLAHLRSPGPHFRGCWSIDLILNKE